MLKEGRYTASFAALALSSAFTTRQRIGTRAGKGQPASNAVPPRDSFDQRLLDLVLQTPDPAEVRWIHDVFGNCVTLVAFEAHPGAEVRVCYSFGTYTGERARFSN